MLVDLLPVPVGQLALQVLPEPLLQAQAKSQIDTIVALVAVLLGLAVVIAVLGIVNALALSIVARTGELGLLRAVSMSGAS